MTAPDADRVFADLLDQLEWLLPLAADGEPDREREYADVVADLLAYLAERMTALHERRLTEVDSFVGWLEERLGCPVDALAGKTKIPRYYEPDVGLAGVLEVIEKNHPSKTSLDVSAPKEYGTENVERARIERGYERSMARLEPILKQIELTDALIDRIVYRLYALTDAQVELVEASAGRDPSAP